MCLAGDRYSTELELCSDSIGTTASVVWNLVYNFLHKNCKFLPYVVLLFFCLFLLYSVKVLSFKCCVNHLKYFLYFLFSRMYISYLRRGSVPPRLPRRAYVRQSHLEVGQRLWLGRASKHGVGKSRVREPRSLNGIINLHSVM